MRFDDEILARGRELMALMLWEKGAVKVNLEEPFTLASGAQSPVYVNCREVISDPVFMQLFTALSRSLLERREVAFDALAGGETAGIPFAAYLARDVGKPMLYVRKKAKGYGTASRVEGRLEPGARLLLVEDLITDGGSKLTFIEALREADGGVEDALVLFDRHQGGEALLARHGVRLHALCDRTTALTVAEQAGILGVEARREVDAPQNSKQAYGGIQ
jgi:orotate phosphoribosyltransferase